MIVVDASALVAILMREPEGPDFREALLVIRAAKLSPIGYWEAAVKLHRFRGDAGVADLDRLLLELAIEVAPATAQTAKTAQDAEVRFGKHTPARLNLGDCFAYALAKELNASLLFKGSDFTQTDIRPAIVA
jgi:ribonuclease VapC